MKSYRKRVTHDFETRSKCNLKIAGAYKYSLDPTTQPTCLAFKILGEPTIYFLDFKMVNTPWKKLPEKLRKLWTRLIEEGYEFSAHNSFFERCIYDNILVLRLGWPGIPPKRRRCTAAKAAACALPRSLEGAGAALKLSIQKDKRGYNAMMATCKPTRAWNAWTKARLEISQGKKVGPKKRHLAESPEPRVFLEYEDDPETWETLYVYCKIDVKAEELLDETLPDLIPQEQEIWHYNQEINWRGLPVDIKTAQKIIHIMKQESDEKLKELDTLTMGLVTKPGARKSILEFLELDGIILPDIRAGTVQDELDGFKLTDDGRRLLEIRKALSKTSTKKYMSFIQREVGGRVRDIQLYHGASTGRDSGSGIQIQNFPRGLLKVDKKRPYAAVQNVINCDEEMLRILYGDSLGILFSSILRNMILPTKGCDLFSADFAKIEVAVCWWLAGNKPGLKILTDGGDPYITLAMMNHPGKKAEDILDEERQLAKHQILGCQFGMGWGKFQTTGWDLHRLRLSDAASKLAVSQYRTLFPAVPALWKEYEAAAIKVVENGQGATTVAGRCRFINHNNFLWIQLPSGRPLAYRDPQISWRESEYGARKTLEFWAVNSKTKKWALERTWGGPLTENITQGTGRDILMPAMVRLEKKGYRGLFSVHDEGNVEKEIGKGQLNEMVKILCEKPLWADGLPIDAKGWVGPRYRK